MRWTALEDVPELVALRALATDDTAAGSPLALLRRTTRVAPLAGGLTNRLYVCEVQPEPQRWVVADRRGRRQTVGWSVMSACRLRLAARFRWSGIATAVRSRTALQLPLTPQAELERVWRRRRQVRVSGEGVEVHFIDRTREFQCLQAAHAAGVTPEARYHLPQRLLCQRFIRDAVTFDNAQCQEHLPQCAALLRQLHAVEPAAFPASFTFDVFLVVQHYLTVARGHAAPLPDDMDALMCSASRVRTALRSSRGDTTPLVPCHNDLLAANWIWGARDTDCSGEATKEGTTADGRLWLVDFEYGALGDPFFDLANFSVNCELTDAQDAELLDCYVGVGAWRPAQLARLKLYKVVSDLREGLWAFVQWGVSTTCSADFYVEYGHRHLRRFAQYAATTQFDTWLVAAAGDDER